MDTSEQLDSGLLLAVLTDSDEESRNVDVARVDAGDENSGGVRS